ncbi:glycoside hydrolase family 88/105 protein [Paenibacillus paridis]|uniref:glycoside hydrolase family 88/105 protein n=1 Tax=Paenibacillus paridis TaxID=2583376 RepID=UPI0011201EF3|nr:glycoside hydrolase family 88 protein [Paenibacillus paridis]
MPTQSWSVLTVDSLMRQYPLLSDHPYLSDCWNYESGCLLLAIARLYERTGSQEYLSYIRKNIDAYVAENGSIRSYNLNDYNLDQVNQGKVLLFLHQQTGADNYMQAARLLISQLEGQPRTEEGSFWHKKVYPYQVWLDGLYMAAPFLAEYARMEKRLELLDDVASQLLIAESRTRNPLTGLLHHAYDESREQEWAHPEHGRSPHAWVRAIGWYGMAIVDVLDFMPISHSLRGQLIGTYERLFAALIRVQDSATGLWHQVLGEEGRFGNYLESSGSAMIVYAAQKALNQGYLSGKYRASADQGYDGLLQHAAAIDEAGNVHVHGINRVAGLGGEPYRDGSFTYYISEQVVSNDSKGVAPFIFACIEKEKGEAALS